jgi:hypothetical protein
MHSVDSRVYPDLTTRQAAGEAGYLRLQLLTGARGGAARKTATRHRVSLHVYGLRSLVRSPKQKRPVLFKPNRASDSESKFSTDRKITLPMLDSARYHVMCQSGPL